LRGAAREAAPAPRGGGIHGWRDRWRAPTPSQTHSSRRETLSVSLQRMTYGPLRRKTLSVSPCEGENLFPEVKRNTGPCVSPLRRGEQEGSSPSQQKTCSRRLANPGALASLPASKTVAVSLQRMTCGPLQARPSLSLPARERTCFRRLSETPALASLPFVGETKRGLPLHSRKPAPGG